jgi:hypothetical protein
MRPRVALSAFLDVSSLNLAVPQAPPFLSGASPSRRMLGRGNRPCGPRLLTKGPGEDILRGRAKPRSAGASTRQRVLAIGRGAGSVGAWCSPLPLAGRDVRLHAPGMFVVSEAEAAAIRAVFDQRGELSAAIELRRLFPSITEYRAGARERSDHCRLEAAASDTASGQAVAFPELPFLASRRLRALPQSGRLSRLGGRDQDHSCARLLPYPSVSARPSSPSSGAWWRFAARKTSPTSCSVPAACGSLAAVAGW